MTRDVQADEDLSPGRGPLPAADEPGGDCDLREDGGIGALGQAICHRLFSAGLDLDFALSLDGDRSSAGRLRHAVAEIDEAIKELRHLMLAVPGPVAGAAPVRISRYEDPESR